MIAFSSQHIQNKHLVNKRVRVLDFTHNIVLLLCSTVERLSPANETMDLPPKKEEKKVGFCGVFITLKAGKPFKNEVVAFCIF